MIEPKRELYCNRCGDFKDHKYSYTDHDARDVWGKDSVDLYRCVECDTLQAHHHRPDLGDVIC